MNQQDKKTVKTTEFENEKKNAPRTLREEEMKTIAGGSCQWSDTFGQVSGSRRRLRRALTHGLVRR